MVNKIEQINTAQLKYERAKYEEKSIKKYTEYGIKRENIKMVHPIWFEINVPLIFRDKQAKKVWEDEIKKGDYVITWHYNITTGEMGYGDDLQDWYNNDDKYIDDVYIKVIDNNSDGTIKIVFSDVFDNELGYNKYNKLINK